MSSDLPLVCICIPTYNAAATIRETLESILAQSYTNLVIHVSDNASADDTLKIVASVADARVHIHRQEKNIGAERNFENCIRLGEGKYTAIFHSDDIYERDMVSKQVALLEGDQTLGAVFTAATTIDEQGKPLGIIGRPVCRKQETCICKFTELIKAVLEHSNFLICPSAMVRTHIYQKEIFRWREDLFGSSADLDVWLRIASKHPVAILSEPLMRYRISKTQWSNSVRLSTERSDRLIVMQHYLAQPEVKAALTSTDWRYYRELEINDSVWRAINLFALGRVAAAKSMLRGVFDWTALLHAALTSRRGFLTLLAAVSLYLLIILRAERIGQAIILQLRKRRR